MPTAGRSQLQAGAVALGAGDEVVEHRVAEGLPPGATRFAFGGRSDGPAAVGRGELLFLESRRRRGHRVRRLARRGRAAGQDQRRDEG
jgi:hypothetical protein